MGSTRYKVIFVVALQVAVVLCLNIDAYCLDVRHYGDSFTICLEIALNPDFQARLASLIRFCLSVWQAAAPWLGFS